MMIEAEMAVGDDAATQKPMIFTHEMSILWLLTGELKWKSVMADVAWVGARVSDLNF